MNSDEHIIQQDLRTIQRVSVLQSSHDESFKFDFFSDLESAESEIFPLFFNAMFIFSFSFWKRETLFPGLNDIMWSWICASMTEDANMLPKYYCRSKHHWLGKAVMYRTVFKGFLPSRLSTWLLLLLPLRFTQCCILLRGDREFYFRPWCFGLSCSPHGSMSLLSAFWKALVLRVPLCIIDTQAEFCCKKPSSPALAQGVRECVCEREEEKLCKLFSDWQNIPLASYSCRINTS